jgi:CelD/BcsL family acetyltransferase involved in cellulose biosynthesis
MADLLDGVPAADWDALALRSRNVFATREWHETWLRHNPSTTAFTLSARRPDGSLLALLPLEAAHRGTGGLTVLRPLGPWPVPERPLICAADDAAEAVRDMTAQLAARGGWDVLEMQAVPADEPWTDGLAGVTLSRTANRTIDVAGRTWEELLATTGSHLRKEIRRRERRLRERYDLRYRRSEPGTVDEDVDVFLDLHWRRWGDEVSVLTPQRAPFLHDFVAQAAERGWLALWFLELDGRPVSAKLDFRFGGKEIFFQSGMDPAFRQDHVGLTLMFHTIREACADGLQEVHFLRGDQPHKDRLPNRDDPVRHLVLSGSGKGNVVNRMRGAKRMLRTAARAGREQLRRVTSPT